MARSARRSRGFVCVPTAQVRPVVTGTAQVGQTLTGTAGTYNFGTVQSRRWLRGSTPISGATALNYVAQAGDVGSPLVLEELVASGRNPANTIRVTSLPTAAVIA